jgi:hypothetical protein
MNKFYHFYQVQRQTLVWNIFQFLDQQFHFNLYEFFKDIQMCQKDSAPKYKLDSRDWSMQQQLKNHQQSPFLLLNL